VKTKHLQRKMENEHNNEYGNGVEDLVRRSDAEYWMERREEREAEMKRMEGGEELLDAVGSGSEGGEEEDWDGEIDLENPMSGRKFVPSNKGMRKDDKNNRKRKATKRQAKLETGSELREKIGEKNRQKEIKKAISAGRKMRKEGKMKDISTYFNC
jgi:hypothetical protein